ncbi:hypothetical protein [Mycobacterium sp. URHB0044]|uniref:hypothetical protein n=1 Tax=Mycobacterium sp. URHB0044 TaxID=1380386 RepID=UPI000688DCA7|nr:hypothetical protein [Mycobacterium sp. URHB0044]
MLVIVGLFVLAIAMVVEVVGVLNDASLSYPWFGSAVGAGALVGLGVLLVGARQAVVRVHDTRREEARFQRETAFINRDRTGDADPAHGHSL